ncbi:DUF4276 family protein [Microcoleus sp. B6-A1]|uniref:DUF4276 family protein n=1 Tax=Microcoleus sp. B6-A1 TaxID=2818684 RepID=UPI002FD4BC33
MKIGMITEGGPQGSDLKVCERFARQLNPNIDIRSIPLGNKRDLIDNCGTTASLLIEQGCDLVLIIWDLYPAWREKGQRPCRTQDCEEIQSSLQNANVKVPPHNVYLICIEAELEEWLLYDLSALSSVLSTPTHPVNIRKKPKGETNPKKVLTKLFKENTGRVYNNLYDAEKIANKISNFDKLKKCPSFLRFFSKITEKICDYQ